MLELSHWGSCFFLLISAMLSVEGGPALVSVVLGSRLEVTMGICWQAMVPNAEVILITVVVESAVFVLSVCFANFSIEVIKDVSMIEVFLGLRTLIF